MTRYFKKLLIANRGEIAVRITRTCRDLGIGVVAVYSDADRAARHVRMADEAWHVGGAASQDSYLQVGKIVEVARRSGADAIHPGYGFLAENPALPAACEEAGIVFVGPTADTLGRIGEKTSARAIASAAGVPIVPGTTAAAKSFSDLCASARRIGYPVLLKACAGGGGKGMRRVESEDALAASWEAASHEAERAFGDPSVYVERAIDRPRHVEVQLLADGSGNVICLGERDCSVQRRHQKLIEETPSPAVGPELRAALFEAATRAARAVNYVNAGTAEFLLDREGNYYFLEVNARLQVEHPVTEEATGLDLVREQLKIAAGGRIGISGVPREGTPRAAIECRVYAEDPYNQFLPSIGEVAVLQQPAGPCVRVESASYPGMVVPLQYDPLLAKLITWGASREEAINRMRRALGEYVVLGVKTSIPFHRFAMEDETFRLGSYDTSFVERWLDDAPHREDLAPIAAAVAAMLSSRRARPTSIEALPVAETSRWGAAARQATMRRR